MVSTSEHLNYKHLCIGTFKLADPLPKIMINFILKLKVCACLAGGYMDIKNGVASPIDFLCKIEVSRFMASKKHCFTH